MADKEFKTYIELIDILRTRGMSIEEDQGSRVMSTLEKENYYNVINGYKDLFLAPDSTVEDEKYTVGTTFDEVYALYNFDREVRNIYLKYLLKAENAFKSVIAHEFSKLYGHDNYLKLENFDTSPSKDKNVRKRIAKQHHLDPLSDTARIDSISTQEKIGDVIQLIGEIQQEIARQMNKHHQVVTHYMTEYGYIPLWVLVNVLTFGKITKFYKLMKQADKITVAKKFGINCDELHKYMDMCSLARNKCAHDERFFDMKFRPRLHTRSISDFDILSLEKDSSGSYSSGTNDIYAIGIIFALMLNRNDIEEFINSMSTTFDKLESQLKTICIDDVMKIIGYNSSWKNLIALKKV